MPRDARRVIPADIISPSQFAKERGQRRAALLPLKRLRRVEVGPHATMYFENYDTMLFQIQEVLYLEKGGPDQVEEEVAAHNPLIPQGGELIATVTFDIDDPERRAAILGRLDGIERRFFIQIDNDRVFGAPDSDAQPSRDDGTDAFVHFVRFTLTKAQRDRFAQAVVMVGSDHEDYAHLAILTASAREELATDFA